MNKQIAVCVGIMSIISIGLVFGVLSDSTINQNTKYMIFIIMGVIIAFSIGISLFIEFNGINGLERNTWYNNNSPRKEARV